MGYQFAKHKLTGTERLWLAEIYTSGMFNPRVAKIRLRGQIPDTFDPASIDKRFCTERALTLLGLWLIDPEAKVLRIISVIYEHLRASILNDPAKTMFTLSDQAENWGYTKVELFEAMSQMRYVGEYSPLGPLLDRVNDRGMGDFDAVVESDSTTTLYVRHERLEDYLDAVYKAKSDTPSAATQLLAQLARHGQSEGDSPNIRIRPGTAFVMMAMDPKKRELDDVYAAIRDTCAEYSVAATRADKLEHDDLITDVILREIRTSEFLIADLTYERPNVYYEVGYAHALKKRPILYRREDTKLHFDLTVHNVREYVSVEHLKELLRKRFAAIFDHEVADKPQSTRKKPKTKLTPAVVKRISRKQRNNGSTPNVERQDDDA